MILDRLIHYLTREPVKGSGEGTIRKKDTHGRSVFKALTWRTWGTLDTSIISFFVTGSFSLAITIGGLELLVGSVGYYIHERLWSAIPWGRAGTPSLNNGERP